MKINVNYAKLTESYLFSTINHKVQAYQKAYPEADIIRLGIGDVTLPLCPAVIQAMHTAVEDMGHWESFHGYGPEQGYAFLREAVAAYYLANHVALAPDEIFISDGAKSDLGNILDLFDTDNVVLIPDPVYPVYVDTNIMAGRHIRFLQANRENGFLPMPPAGEKADIIYICSPNNPTGAVYTRAQLSAWVEYAKSQDAVILFDAAYEAFISDSAYPKSIYEIEGAKSCAIEFCSLSKTAGFTGTRCGYTIVPAELVREGKRLRDYWLRRQTTKFNGVPYVIQKAAAAVFTPEGQQQTRESLQYYQRNTALLGKTLQEAGIWYTGGVHSPYLWLACPDNMASWDFFDFLLTKANIVGTPGAGFGKNGEGFFRLTGFGSYENAVKACGRLKKLL